MTNPNLFNAHLEGDPFYWHGGEDGVLLIHGMTATSAEVRLFAKKLQAAGYSVAGPLLAGHGTTPTELNHTPWTGWVASAEEVYRQLKAKCRRVIVGGESAGALIALYLASVHEEIPLLLLYAPVIRLNITKTTEIQGRLASLFIESFPKGNLDASKNWQGYRVNPLKAALQLMALQKEIICRLPSIHQPVLVVQGRLDKTIHPSSGSIILSSIGSPVKELHWFEHSSHVVLLDQELDAITDLSLAFIHMNLPA